MGRLGSITRAILGCMTPYEQMLHLRRRKGDYKAWERFRDSLMRRWSNLNVICGLIMGAVSTIVFADFPLSRGSFALGIISLLSSLIAIGFGVGLIYVLGDVKGSSLHTIDLRYPNLYLFALSIPEVWAFISFGSFFTGTSVIVWQAPNKGWIVKAGVALSAAVLVAHLVAFAFLFREQDTTEYLIPDTEVLVPDIAGEGLEEKKGEGQDASQKFTKLDGMDQVKERSRERGNGSVPKRPGLQSSPLRSSLTLVGSRSFYSPRRAGSLGNPVPGVVQRSLDEFVAEPVQGVTEIAEIRRNPADD